MSDGLDINILTGRAKEIAAEVDNKNVKDGKLSEKEISVFLAKRMELKLQKNHGTQNVLSYCQKIGII